MKGQYLEDEYHGELIGYYEGGNQRCQVEYHQGIPNGPFKVFYDNGIVMMEGVYENGKLMEINTALDYKGQALESTSLKDGTGSITFFSIGQSLQSKLQFKNGLLHGLQKTYRTDGKLDMEVGYKDGELHGQFTEYQKNGEIAITGTCSDGFKTGTWTTLTKTNTYVNEYQLENETPATCDLGTYRRYETHPTGKLPLKRSVVFTVVEEMPEFFGGVTGMANYLRSSVTYPGMEKQNDIQGVSYVQFVVNTMGEIERVKIAPGTEGKATDGMHRVAMNSISNMPRWIPGFQNGAPVKVSYSIPVRFKLR